jgi:hypothetical protein
MPASRDRRLPKPARASGLPLRAASDTPFVEYRPDDSSGTYCVFGYVSLKSKQATQYRIGGLSYETSAS